MRKITLCLILFLVGCKVETQSVSTIPAKDYGLGNSLALLVDNKEDAHQLAAAADYYAELIEFDGTLDEPAISNTLQLEERMSRFTLYSFQGRSLITEDAADKIHKLFTEKLELTDEGQEMTSELRQEAADIYRAVAWSLRQ